jgi:cytochrome c556
MTCHWQGSLIAALTAIGLALLPTSAARTEPANHEHAVTLRAIMGELGAEYLRLTNALMTEDFRELEASAKAIAGHPLPDEIATAIKSKLGRSFSAFETIDNQSHQAAADLARRAAAKDITGSARAFGRLAQSCVSCHKQFRPTLRPLSDQ